MLDDLRGHVVLVLGPEPEHLRELPVGELVRVALEVAAEAHPERDEAFESVEEAMQMLAGRRHRRPLLGRASGGGCGSSDPPGFRGLPRDERDEQKRRVRCVRALRHCGRTGRGLLCRMTCSPYATGDHFPNLRGTRPRRMASEATWIASCSSGDFAAYERW